MDLQLARLLLLRCGAADGRGVRGDGAAGCRPRCGATPSAAARCWSTAAACRACCPRAATGRLSPTTAVATASSWTGYYVGLGYVAASGSSNWDAAARLVEKTCAADARLQPRGEAARLATDC